MQNNHHALRSALIIALFWGIPSGVTNSDEFSLTDQTLQVIEDCISRKPSLWPDEWKKDYLETIRKAIELNRDVPHYAVRLEILGKGFAPYWEGLSTTRDRFLFEVYRTRIRWYTEHLMGTEFPTDQERKKLRDQYKDIWDHAADSLLKQFPFLDPNAVQNAKQDDLSVCYRKIDAPLIPVYMRPIPEEQVGQIKQRWDKLRYIRVDLWRRFGGNSTTPAENRDAPSSNAEHDYELTQKSLSQLLGQIWMVVHQRPDYYRNAVNNRARTLEHRFQLNRQARSDQQRVEKERSRQLLQTEHISFMLAALLETPVCLDGSESVMAQELTASEQREKSSKGGGVYEVDNDSTEK